MRSNAVAVNRARTHEGGMAAPRIVPVAQLRRLVSTCMLFEDTFYSSGSDVAAAISEVVKRIPDWSVVGSMAVTAREDLKLRHVPLFLLALLDERRGVPLAAYVRHVVKRPDEMGELLSIIKKRSGKTLKKCLSAQVKKGLAAAFVKFSAYQLAKWNRASEIKLRDVMFLCHPKPKDADQAAVWKKLIDGTLEAPDTWEVALSAGSDKRSTWERLLEEKKLGYMALLMNLRNMAEASVRPSLVETALLDGARGSCALPFRFVSAAKAAPRFAQALSDAMVSALDGAQKMPGSTAILVDVSGSMGVALSAKGTLTRQEAASALAVLVREVAEHVRVFTFSDRLVEVPNLRGLALMGEIDKAQPHRNTYLENAVKATLKDEHFDRCIVITDEQAHDSTQMPAFSGKGYLVNVAPYSPGLQIGGCWTRINGFSERIVDWILQEEANDARQGAEAADRGGAIGGSESAGHCASDRV